MPDEKLNHHELAEELFRVMANTLDGFLREHKVGAAIGIGVLDILKMRMFVQNEASICEINQAKKAALETQAENTIQ